jgi:hypothetical protein
MMQEEAMLSRSKTRRLAAGSIATALSLTFAIPAARAFDETKYPEWTAYWMRAGSGTWDPSKPPARGQQPPLTEEYKALWEASMADQASGGQGNNPMAWCIPPGMPRTMIDYEGMEVIIRPSVTYFLILEPQDQIRRVFTDGRKWPEDIMPSYLGYSIGTWVDEDGDGRFDTLLVETRGLKTDRSFETSGIPFHKDGETVVKEKIYLDKADPNLLTDEITTIDHALTRPWTVKRQYRRDPKEVWVETACSEDQHQVRIGNEAYYVGAGGELLPTRKDQPAPDLKSFSKASK